MSAYQLLAEDPLLYWVVIAIRLVVTVVAYGAGPFIYWKTRRTPVTKTKVTIFCIIYTTIIALLFILERSLTSTETYTVYNSSPAFIWGTIYHIITLHKLKKRGLLVEKIKSPHSELMDVEQTPTTALDKKTFSQSEPTFSQQEKQEETKRIYSPLDPPEKRPTKYAPLWITICLIIALIGTSVFCCMLLTDNHTKVLEVEALSAQLKDVYANYESLQGEHESLKAKYKILDKKYEDISSDAEFYESLYYDFSDEYWFLNEKIGFIVNGSKYYHNFSCQTFTSADTFWAHNIEYCSYLGYSKCPNCW